MSTNVTNRRRTAVEAYVRPSTAEVYVPGEFDIEVPSGRYLDFVDPQPESITLGDIAHSLAMICRFGGHCSRRYSVAEHAVRVSWKLEQMGYGPYIQMAGLHHDDAEAYLGDIPSPLKGLFGYSYRSLTRSIDACIHEAIGQDLWDVRDFQSEGVKLADNWALCCEAHELMPSKGAGWANAHAWGVTDPDARSYGWDAATAEETFLCWNTQLTGVLKR
jgi:hypothetical protein